MADVLSQEEIDKLLNEISSGSLDEEEIQSSKLQKRVRNYDFRRPNKFSKDQIHSLQNIYDNFCRALTTYLSGNLHTMIEGKVTSIEQITYDEFIRSLPNPTVLGIFKLAPLEGSLLMEINPTLVFVMVDRLLGGQGLSTEKGRDLTEIERTIIERRLIAIIELMGESWKEVYALTSQFVTMETNPQFTQIVAPNEMVLLITLEVKIGETVGLINICLPYLVLEPILEKLSTLFLFSTQAKVKSPEQVEAIRRKIQWAKVDVSACLGQTEILVRELLELAPGDVLPLDQSVQRPLSVYVGSFEKFRAVPGVNGDHLAVQVTETIEEGRE